MLTSTYLLIGWRALLGGQNELNGRIPRQVGSRSVRGEDTLALRRIDEYFGLAEKALGDANSDTVDERKQQQLLSEAQVWASLAIAAATVASG